MQAAEANMTIAIDKRFMLITSFQTDRFEPTDTARGYYKVWDNSVKGFRRFTLSRAVSTIRAMASNAPVTTPAVPSELYPEGVRLREMGKTKRPFKWLDYQSPTPAQLDALQQEYQLHPLAMEDVRTFDERAKVLD